MNLFQIPPKIPVAQQSELSRELNVKMPLCYDKRIYTTTLSKEERHKHHHFTQKTILREDVSFILYAIQFYNSLITLYYF